MKRARLCLFLLLTLAMAARAQEASGHPGAERDLTMWKWANFALLAGALGFLTVKYAGPFFSRRSAEIRRGIDEARRLKEEAEARAARMEQRLAGLSAEVEALRRNAKEEAAQEAQRIREETERELAKIQANADREIASTARAARLELRRYSAELAVGAARDKIARRLTAADQDALIQGFLADLGRQGTNQ